jgi:hypothetical protein
LSAGDPPSDAYTTTVTYVETFYPLWFTYKQASTSNRIVGPERVSPLYHAVVAINDDTIYCSSYLNLDPTPGNGGEPVMMLTIPDTVSPETCSDDTSVTYSILVLDPYGNVTPGPTPSIPHGTPPIMGGTYALTGPDYAGVPEIPPGVTHISMPVNYPTVIFRTDKYHAFDPPTYENQIHEADRFRLALQLQTLDEYLDCEHRGHTRVFPELAFATPYKTIADSEIENDPILFLRELQTAVASARTPQMSAYEQSLADNFNDLFGNGDHRKKSDFGKGAQTAHDAILNNYVTDPTHVTATNWTHFTNIGNWDDESVSDAIDRSSITEFCQYCNDISTAAYYHAFRDDENRPLNGKHPHGYVLTFPPAVSGEAYPGPEASRFWSLTAYTPEAIELVPNPINQYVVASYSGAQLNPDGSLSIYMAAERPAGVPIENWLPVPNGPFNIMLRVYGVVPGSSVAENTYAPPPITSGR